MRKLIYAINISIDGCLDHTKMLANEELHQFFTQLLWDSGLLVYGRITYQLMVPYWPNVAKNHFASKTEKDFADAFNAIDKVVFSKSMSDVGDHRTRVVRTDMKDEILTLKQQPGKDMLLGGVDLPSQLMALGLIDEYLFVVNPVIAGGGKRLLEGIDLPGRLNLTLVDSQLLPSGHIALHYVKK